MVTCSSDRVACIFTVMLTHCQLSVYMLYLFVCIQCPNMEVGGNIEKLGASGLFNMNSHVVIVVQCFKNLHASAGKRCSKFNGGEIP